MADPDDSFSAMEGFPGDGIPSDMFSVDGSNAWDSPGAVAHDRLPSGLFRLEDNAGWDATLRAINAPEAEPIEALVTREQTVAQDVAGRVASRSERSIQQTAIDPALTSETQNAANPLPELQFPPELFADIPLPIPSNLANPVPDALSLPFPPLTLPQDGGDVFGQGSADWTLPISSSRGANLVKETGMDLQLNTILPSIESDHSPNSLTTSEARPAYQTRYRERQQAPYSSKRSRNCISHRREKKRSIGNDPRNFYDPLPDPPPSWGLNLKTKTEVFRYTEEGELEIGKTYSTKELLHFIRRPNKTPTRAGEHLILWVQNPPAQFTHRYPSPVSSMCRWDGCPIKRNTILKGHWRVAFDEMGDEMGEIYNPFHNAGYVHLYCLEMCCDLIELFLDPTVDIRPDMRRMAKEQKNPMSLIRDRRELEGVLDEWVEDQTAIYRAWDRRRNGRRKRTESDFLYKRLTVASLELEGPGRSTHREERGGVHLARYNGDLALYAKLKYSSDGKEQEQGSARHESSAIPPARVARNHGDGSTLDDSWMWRKSSVIEVQAPNLRRPHNPPAEQVRNTRKRNRREEEDGPEPEQSSPKRRMFSVAKGGEATAGGLDNLDTLLSRTGPVTRRQSKAIDRFLERFSTAGRETAQMIQLVQTLPAWKRRALHILTAEEAEADKRVLSL